MLGFGAIGQFAIGQQNTAGGAEVITVDKWFQPLSEPVRFKRGLAPKYQQTIALHPLPIVNISWFSGLSEPVRQKIGLHARYQQFSTVQNIKPIVPFGWFAPLSEPVRKKPRLPESEQPYLSIDLLPTVLMDWFSSLSEPKRFKQGLRADLGIVLARGEFVPLVYTASMDVAELGDFFQAILAQFNIPITAYVDIIENDPTHLGNLGVIASAPTSSTIAAIIEPNPVQAAGIVSQAAVGARVAIIIQ